VITLVQSDSIAKAVAVTRGKGARHVNKLMDYSQIITNFANNKAKTFNKASLKYLERSYFLIFLLTISALVLSALITFFFYRSVNQNLSLLVNRIRKVFERKGEYSAQKNEKNILKILDFSVYELEKSLKITEDYQRHLEKVVDERTKDLTKELNERVKLERSLHNFFEQPLSLHIIANTEGTIIRVNKAWEEKLAYNKEELEGSNFLDYVHPDDISATKKEMRKLERGEYSAYFENRYKNKNGSYHVLAWSSVPDVKERLIYAVAIDVTDQKKTLIELKENKDLLDRVIKGSNDAPWDWDLKKDELYYSPQWWYQLGMEINEVPADSNLWANLMHPNDTDRVNSFFADALKNQDSYEVEFRLKHKTGHYITVLSRGFITRNEKGEAIRVSGTNMDLTQRIEERKKLKESELKYKDLYENAPAMFASVDHQTGLIIDCNQQLIQKTGYSKKEIIGTHVLERYESVEDAKDAFIQFQKTGQLKNVELKLKAKKGKMIDVLLNVSSVKDSEGKILYSRSVWQDISEKKKLEQKALNELKFSDELINSLPGLFYQINDEGKFTKWNRNFEAVSEYNSEEMKSISPLDLFTGKDKDHIAERIAQVFNEGESSAEAEFTSKSGKQTPYFFSGKQIVYNNRTYMVGLGLDLSDIKKAEKALHETELKFKASFENSPDLVALTELDGTIINMNKVAEGYKKEDVLGTNITDYLSDDLKKEFHQAVKESIKTGEPKSYEPIIKNPEGKDIYWYNRLSVIFEKEKPKHLVINFTDITKQKRTEEELKEYRENLEIKVKEKTEELEAMNEELSSSNEELLSSNDELRNANTDLEKYHDLFIQREFRIKELN
jgi:PAS domain S-box-containing protein